MKTNITSEMLEKLLKDAMDKAEKAVKAGNSEGPDEYKAAKKIANDAISYYNSQLALKSYQDWAAEGPDAVEKALRARYVPGAKKFVFKKDKDTGIIACTMGEIAYKVNLVIMWQEIGDSYFHSPDWFTMNQSFVFIIANALNKELGGDASFKYNVTEAAMAFQFAPDANPASSKSVVKALQACVDAIIYKPTTNKKGDEVNAIKMDSRHFACLRESLTAQGQKPGQVVIGSTLKMTELVADLIHVVLTNGQLRLTEAE